MPVITGVYWVGVGPLVVRTGAFVGSRRRGQTFAGSVGDGANACRDDCEWRQHTWGQLGMVINVCPCAAL